MSTLDDAIAAHAAHPAGGLSDPLTDSLAEQTTQPMPLHPTVQLREGWEHERIDVPMPFLVGVTAVLFGCLVLPYLLKHPHPGQPTKGQAQAQAVVAASQPSGAR